MKKTICLLILILITTHYVFTNEKKDNALTLTIIVNNIRSDNGNIRVHLYEISNHESFPDKSTKANYLKVANICGGKAIVTFDNLPPSVYAFTVHHDENANVKMDRNFLGLPIEGWALSNDVKPLFKLPSFRECSFELQSNKKFSISINYSI